MLIKQDELEKICRYLYPKFFDVNNIILEDLKIKINDYLHLNANINYFDVEARLEAIARIRVEDKIIIDINGVIKYGFINLNLNKVLKEIIKNKSLITINDESIIIDNNYIKDISLKDGYMEIELV